MDTVLAYERRANKSARQKAPLSLFDICASLLWSPKTTTKECHSLIYNCRFCFFAASHLAREHAAIEEALEHSEDRNCFVENYYSDEPGLYFYLSCQKEVVKKSSSR